MPFRNGSRSFSEFLTLARRGTAKLCIEDGLLANQNRVGVEIADDTI